MFSGGWVVGFLLFSAWNCKATVYFEDTFSEGNIDKWQKSEVEADKLGVAAFAKPKSLLNDDDGGLKTTEDAKFYRYSAKFDKPLSNKGKKMCVQFSVKHEQDIDCGGGYVKIAGEEFKPKEFMDKTNYEIMFGPDICGYDTRKVHVIFSHDGKNHDFKKTVPCKTDTFSHLYTLNLHPDNTFEVLIDRKSVEKGNLAEDYEMVPPAMIDDPSAKKPDDWVDEAEIPDPEDKKPEDWDKPKTIVDDKAKKPEDWDDETDGEWTAPMIDNPDYKGEWHPKMISNPAYKGEWKAPQIDNPEYKDDPNLYARTLAYIGLDLWQVKSGTIFDNFIVSDDLAECEKHAEEHWKKRFEFEEEEDKKKRAEEEAKMKADSEKNPEEEEDKEDEDEADIDEPEDEKKSDDESKKHEEL